MKAKQSARNKQATTSKNTQNYDQLYEKVQQMCPTKKKTQVRKKSMSKKGSMTNFKLETPKWASNVTLDQPNQKVLQAVKDIQRHNKENQNEWQSMGPSIAVLNKKLLKLEDQAEVAISQFQSTCESKLSFGTTTQTLKEDVPVDEKQKKNEKQNSDQAIQIEKLQTELMVANQKVKTLEASHDQLQSVRRRCNDLENDMLKCKQEQTVTEGSNSDLLGQISDLQQSNGQLQDIIQQKEEDNLKSKNEIATLKSEKQVQWSKIQSQEVQVSQLRQNIIDQNGEIEKQQGQWETLNQDKEQLSQKLLNLQDEKYQESQQFQKQLETLLYFYIPKRGDVIDEALANFINTFPEKMNLKILFLRESEGVYMFGQKKVYIKVESGNEIKVRVGGGFISGQEFIEQFQNLEVEKLQRRDVISRFRDKVRTQQISSRLSVYSQEERPVSKAQKHQRNRSVSSEGVSPSPILLQPRQISLEKIMDEQKLCKTLNKSSAKTLRNKSKAKRKVSKKEKKAPAQKWNSTETI